MINIIKIKDTIRDKKPNRIVYVGTSMPNIPELGFEAQEYLNSDVMILNPVGFTSCPDEDDLAYTFETDDGDKFCITSDYLEKPHTEPNEVCVGNFKTNNYVRINDNQIKIENNGTEEIYTKTTKLTSISSNDTIELVADKKIVIKAPEVVVEGNMTINGNLTVNGMITSQQGMTVNGKVIDDVHTHSGVQSGSSTTGGVN